MYGALFCLLATTASPALGKAPEDITLSGMNEHDGAAVVASVQDDYFDLLRELATAISNKPALPTRTLGAAGFDIAWGVTIAGISAKGDAEGPSPWERAHAEEDPGAAMALPYATIRKGLPYSIEVGSTMAWLAGSGQLALSGFGRVGIVEGFQPLPDISARLGYTGYIGNDELEVGVLDLGVSVGTTLPFGSFPGVRNAKFSPFLDYSTLRVRAAPVVDAELAEELGLLPVSASKNSGTEYQPAMIVPQFGGGFQIQTGNFLTRLALAWAPTTIPTATVGMGLAW
jgi:hypothetical protein